MVTGELVVEEALCNVGIHDETKINAGMKRNEIKIVVFGFISKIRRHKVPTFAKAPVGRQGARHKPSYKVPAFAKLRQEGKIESSYSVCMLRIFMKSPVSGRQT